MGKSTISMAIKFHGSSHHQPDFYDDQPLAEQWVALAGWVWAAPTKMLKFFCFFLVEPWNPRKKTEGSIDIDTLW